MADGVEPAWTMLEFNSLNALRHEPSTSIKIPKYQYVWFDFAC